MTGKLLYLAIVIYGSSLCAVNLWATLMKWPCVCFQTRAKCINEQNKTNTQAFILFIAPFVIVTLAIASCYCHADSMLANAPTLINYLFPYTTVGEKVQQMIFWMAIIIRQLTMLTSSLYLALACSIMIQLYVHVTTLHEELLIICKKQQLQSELQIWWRKFGFLRKVLRSVTGYLGCSMLTILIMSVSTLILAIFQPIGEENVELGLLLSISNTIALMTALTVPSAILNGKVSTDISSIVRKWNLYGTPNYKVGYWRHKM